MKRISILFVSILFLSALGFAEVAATNAILVGTAWVEENLADIVLVEIGRTPETFASGHIPGAVLFDRSGIYAEVDGIPGMFPGVDVAVEAIEKAGISNDSRVVIYDAANSLWAARLFWTLEYLGHERVSVVDGGFQKWQHENRSLFAGSSVVSAGSFDPDVQDSRLLTADHIASRIGDPNFVVVDTRSPAEYLGEDVRSAEGGHIPGSVNINWINNIIQNEGEPSRFLPLTELAELYDVYGVEKSKSAVTLCQTGVRGAHTYFALRLLGFQDVALYDGSWAEWGNSDRPVEE